MNDAIETLRAQLQQLKDLHEAGTLATPAYEAARAPLERRLVDLVTGGAAPVPAAAAAVPAQAPAAAATPASVAAATPTTVAEPGARPSWRLVAGIAVTVVAVAAAGYAWTGSPSLIGGVPAATAPGDNAAPPHAKSPTPEQIAGMVEKLAQRLKDKPDDPEGWTMLARAYMVLGRPADALPAYAKAVELRPDDAGLLADYADSMAMQNGRQLDGEPMKLLERALKAEPGNLKALALAGTAAFDRKEYAQAVQYWEKLLQGVPDDSAYRGQVQAGIDEARQLGKLPPSATAQAAPAATAAPVTSEAAVSAAGGASVSGSVTIAAALADKASPTDTVFVFARAAEGPRMPLAVLRKQVKDLPFDFRLDDSMAMSPAAKLSGAARVIVGARVSKSGDAIPQDGDLLGQSAPVTPGASGLKIEIAEVVKK